MPFQNSQRKRVAVLAAGLVCYSSKTEGAESGASDGIQQLRKHVLEPLVSRFQGRIFRFTDDGVFAEFANVINAVECSIEIQSAVFSKNEKLPITEWVGLRIGLSLGEVLVMGDDLFGNAVNIAARLGDLVEPSTICGVANGRKYFRTTIDPVCANRRDQTVKNVNKPIGTSRIPPIRLLASKRKTPGVEDSARSIVILPFQNLIVDPEQKYFADRITDELIITVSQFKKFRVISRNLSYVYKGRSLDVRQVARKLDVRYVLEGSVRLGGDRLRITGQLIEGEGGTLVWADRYDGELDDATTLQDRIAGALIGVIESTIRSAEIERGRRRHCEPLRLH